MLALPLAPSSWHGPEVASVLAVSATALLAGQRWAIALVVLAQLLVLPTVGPRAFLRGNVLSVRLAGLGDGPRMYTPRGYAKRIDRESA